MAQSWGKSTAVQSPSSNARLPAGRKFPVFWNVPVLPLPKLKSLAASLAFPKWNRQPKSRSSRSRPAPGAGEALGVVAGSGPGFSPDACIATPIGPSPLAAATAAGASRPVLRRLRREKVSILPPRTPRGVNIPPASLPRNLIGVRETRQYTLRRRSGDSDSPDAGLAGTSSAAHHESPPDGGGHRPIS